MLRKLMKYEFAATSHMFLPLYALVAVITPVTGLLSKLSTSGTSSSTISTFITGGSLFIYVVSLLVLCVASFIFAIMRFYKNLVTEEAYLTHTLPATTNQLVFAKSITAFIWQLCTSIIFLASLTVYGAIYGKLSTIYDYILNFFSAIPQELRSNITLFIGLIIASFIISLLYNMYQIYAAISIGQIVQNHRVLASFGFYLVLYTLTQMISSIALVVYGLITKTNMFTQSSSASMSTMIGILIISNVITIVLTIVYHFITVYMMKNKLNLE